MCCQITRKRTVGDGGCAAVANASAAIPDVGRESTPGDRQSPTVGDTGTPNKRAAASPATERQPFERKGPRRGDREEAENWGTGVPFDDRCLSPVPRDGERAGDHREPIGVVVHYCQGIGACLQANRILLPIGIRRIDGVDEALNPRVRSFFSGFQKFQRIKFLALTRSSRLMAS